MFYKFFFVFFLFFINCYSPKEIHTFQDKWKYKIGFQDSFLTEDPQGWSEVDLPANYSKQLKITEGYITLKKEVPKNLSDQYFSGKPLAISAGRMLDISSVYWNQTLVGSKGKVDPYTPGAMRYLIEPIPFSLHDNTLDKNYITIVLYSKGNFPLQSKEFVKVGQASVIYTEYILNEVIVYIFISIYFFMALYHLLLAYKRREDSYNFYFGLASLSFCFYWFMSRTTTQDLLFHDHVILARKLEHVILFLSSPFILLFFVTYFYKRIFRYPKYYLYFSVAISILSLINLELMRVARTLFYVGLIYSLTYSSYIVVKEIKRKNPDAFYMIIGLIAFFTTTIIDILSSLSIIRFIEINHIALFLFSIGVSGIMANKFMRVMTEVEDLNASLEKKVKDRTKELSETLKNVQELKQQQDGDYFLTSLLIKPLSGNFIQQKKSGNFLVKMYTEQKKKFLFKNRTYDIGGDISIIDSISLKKTEYLVFMNADAMGKSIQGAGGAIVIGTVFKSIIERTHAKEELQNIYPEIWIKETFKEIQNVFVSFDGTMLISAVFGLLDPSNGAMYYINAEHPYVILYRDDVADFLDTTNHVRKIGIDGLEGNLHISICKLHPHDMIILGSDGRDDIMLGKDVDGQRVINEDERLILKIIKASKGDIEQIPMALKKIGEVTDDLSLLSITYNIENNADTDPAYKRIMETAETYLLDGYIDRASDLYESVIGNHPIDPIPLKQLIQIHLKQKKYEKCSFLLDKYLRLEPSDNEAIYFDSFIKKELYMYKEAIESGERLRLREPKNVQNLIHLAEIYIVTNNRAKAEKLIYRALHLEPSNPKVIDILSTSFQKS